MKLYYSPGSCSLSPHSILRELDLPFELVTVNVYTKKLADGGDFLAINPKGAVAVLELDDGQRLTESAAIVQYLADLKPEIGIAPANGTLERARLQECLNFLSSEVHANFSPLFVDALPDVGRDIFKDRLFRKFDLIEATLRKQDYLLSGGYSVADAYSFALLRFAPVFDIDLERWPAITAYMQRIAARPAMAKTLEVEAAAKAA